MFFGVCVLVGFRKEKGEGKFRDKYEGGWGFFFVVRYRDNYLRLSFERKSVL